MASLTDSQTSLSLMETLRVTPRDAEAWDRFVRRYRPKIYGWCRAYGLQEADAEDVAQEVISKLAQKMASFRYDQTRSFRAWLKTVTQHALCDLVSSRSRAVGSLSAHVLDNIEARADLERRIEEILNRELLDLAIGKVRARVAHVTWEAFRLTAFDGRTGAEAAETLSIPIASVFVARHRVQKLIKEEIDKMDGGPG
jgi:RNA polymerase sigma factor (sigma-70 family)